MARTKNLNVPRLIAGVNVMTLPLSPLEGFVMSRIDGVAPVHLLADLTALDEAEVARIVARLVELGAAEWVRESVHLPRASAYPPARTPSAPFDVPSALRERRGDFGSADTMPAMPAMSASEPPEGSESAPASVQSESAPASALASIPDSAQSESALGSESGPASARSESAPASARSESARSESANDADELDLDPERRAQIDALHGTLDQLDHYRVLGVERDATRAEVREAYFRLSKVFHPDTMFRKRLGPYKARMEAVFSRLTEAYEVLGKKRARQEYDRYLALQDQTREVEDVLEQAAEPVEPEPVVEPPAVAPLREPDLEAIARRRALRAKSLRRAAGASAVARRRESSSPPSEPALPDRAEVLRSLTRSLKTSASHTGGVDPAQRHVESARRAEEAGDLAEAARELRSAVSLAPDRADLRAEHARVDARLMASLSHTYEEQALYEQRHGKWAAAAISWRKVFSGRPDDARAAREAARALVEAEGDLHRAQRLAQRAVELSPDDVLNLRVLGRVYLAAGLRLNARRVLQRAATLDPSDEMVETLLRSLGRD